MDEKGVKIGDADQNPESGVIAGVPPAGTEEPSQIDPEKAGLIKARDAEAQKARELKDANDKLLKLVETFSQPKQQSDSRDPDDVVTVGEVETLLKRQAQEFAQKEQLNKTVNNVKQVKEKYANTDFNYDSALEFAKNNFSSAQIQAILASDTPAQDLYDLALIKSGKYKSQVQQDAVKKTVDTINSHMNSPGTISKAGGNDRVIDQIKQVDQMSRDDFIKFANSVVAKK